jgi:DNA-binding NarL/FixJ family response regulator
MGHKISLLIVEPSDIVIGGIRQCLDESRFNVLASLHDTQNLAERLLSSKPDLLLLNPTLPAAPMRAQLAQWQQQRPGMAIVALVYQYVEPTLLSAFRAVLDINISCNKVTPLLLEACDNAQEDDSDSTENYELSDRETDILVLVAKGLSSKEIADKLHISVHTVSTHRKNITHKTGIKSVAGLAVYAMLHNLM